MSNSIRVTSGGSSAKLTGKALELANNYLNKTVPKLKNEMLAYLNEIEQTAKKNWLVRAKNSKRSIDKFYTQFYLTPNLELIAGIGNKAPYAFIIKVGEKSRSKFAVGKNLATVAVIDPAMIMIDKLTEKIADEIIRTV